MKILYYNWDHVDGSSGGGVVVYQKNLIMSMLKENHDVVYLNSGLTYDGKGMRLKKISNSIGMGLKTFEVIDSPVIAPVQQSPKNIQMYLEDEKLYRLIKEFIVKEGPFDIIHFNNLEGLSLKVLELKKEFKNTKFIYSLHNYFPICTRVNLWKDEKTGNPHNCDKKDYSECINCYNKLNYEQVIFCRKNTERKILKKAYVMLTNYKKDKADSMLYKQFERKTIELLNCNMDLMLAVSNRVKMIFEQHGVDGKKIITSYIGTQVASSQKRKSNANVEEKILKIVYMGYMREEKGFYFFLNAMEKLAEKYPTEAKNISIEFIARYSKKNQNEIQRINNLKTKYAEIKLTNGYTKDNQEQLLTGKHLGVVPVLWEDNLPQVAIEQIAYGVPIIVSDLGGAKELFDDNKFVFKAGNEQEFIKKVLNIQSNRKILQEFWAKSKKLVTMKEHLNQIMQVYEGSIKAEVNNE